MNKPYFRIAAHTICGSEPSSFLAPKLDGETWVNLFRADPVTTFVGFLLGLLNIYVAIGQPGVHCLNRIFGRFDQEREITLTPGGVKIQQGRRSGRRNGTSRELF
jgi:hypothetical protein